MTENKIRADANAVNFSKIPRQTANKFLAGLLAEFFVELNQQQCVRAERFNRAQFLRQRINQRRHAIRRDDGIGMPVKSQNDCNRIVLTRIRNCLPDDLLMSKMHAVEKTDRKADFFAFGLQFICGVDDFHDAASFKKGMTRFSSSATGIFKISSSGFASAMSNFPETLRRNVARCAPQPSFWPRSCAILRT